MQEQQCYPCSVHGRQCVLDEAWEPKRQQRRRVLLPVLPYSNIESSCSWFDVALWRYSDQRSLPLIGYVEAVNAYAAVEQMMQHYRLRRVAVASARCIDLDGKPRSFKGLLVYRASWVWASYPVEQRKRDKESVNLGC